MTAPPPLPGRWLVPTLVVATLVNFTGSLALSPFLPEIAAELQTTVALVGQIPALVMLLAALLGLVIGPLADHYGYSRTLLLALVAVAVSAAGTGLASTYAFLLVVSIIGAVGRAAVLPAAQATVAARLPTEAARRTGMSWVGIGHSCAVVVGIPLLTFVAAGWGWRTAMLVLAGIALAALLLAWRALPPDEAAPHGGLRLEDVLATYPPLLQHRSTRLLVLASLLGNTGMWALWSYLPAYLIEARGFSTQEVGWVYSATGVAITIGTLIGVTRLIRRPRAVIVVGRLIPCVCFAFAMYLPMPAFLLVSLVTLGMVAEGSQAVANALLLTAETPGGRATTLTLNSSALSLGNALGGALGGAALSLAGYEAVWVWAPTFILASAVAIWWSSPRHAQVEAIGYR